MADDLDTAVSRGVAPSTDGAGARPSTALWHGPMRSISTRLLRSVMSIYLLLTLVIFGLEVTLQYFREEAAIQFELGALQKTFHDSLSHSLWHMDPEEITTTAQAVLNMPSVAKIVVRMPNEAVLRSIESTEPDKLSGLGHGKDFMSRAKVIKAAEDEDGKAIDLGYVEMYSNQGIILNRLRPGVTVGVAAAALKTLALIALVQLFFRRILSRPLFEIARQAGDIDPTHVQTQPLPVKPGMPDELDVISGAINGLSSEVARTVTALDDLNKSLERQVADRTQSLAQANAELASQGTELRDEVALRRRNEADLHRANRELEESLERLQLAQQSLIQSEKMAALGALVAGVAHEINTPVGLSLTGASHFKHMVERLEERFRAGELEEPDFERFLSDSKELARSIYVSLEKAANLVSSFKLVAVDQAKDDLRDFQPSTYIRDVMLTHHQVLRLAGVQTRVSCPDDLTLRSYAGSWSQILSNFINNSVIHGFPETQTDKVITIDVRAEGDQLLLDYRDNGAGMTAEVASHAFDPFFTTNRKGGGSGLGLHVVYNLVTQQLHGQITLDTHPGQGVRFLLRLPIDPREPMAAT